MIDRIKLETEILSLGTEIFNEVQNDQLSLFDPQFYTGKLMNWAMQDEEFKIALFRFVDVLPALTQSSAVIQHAQEYFKPVAYRIPGLLKWGLDVDPRSIAAKIAAQLVRKQIRSMAERFILGETPKEALKPLRKIRKEGMSFTVDLLGEATVGEEESKVYVQRYLDLLDGLNKEVRSWPESAPLIQNHRGETTPLNISVKLSALYSQVSPLNAERAVATLAERFGSILARAKQFGAFVYMDMEDTKMTSITLDTVKRVLESAEFKHYEKCGVVLQAYLRRTEADLLELIEWTKRRGTPIAVRLVKGAYWDTETIVCKQMAWPIPVWQEKAASDANYEKLSLLLLENSALTMPAFGSHNIRSLVHAVKAAELLGVPKTDFELQALFGMAEPIKRAFVKRGYLVRDYAPVGELIPGMGYLVRRLLENTSNEGFLRLGFHEHEKPETLLVRPQPKLADSGREHLVEYAARDFSNTPLRDFSEKHFRDGLARAIQNERNKLQSLPSAVSPIVGGKALSCSKSITSVSPEDPSFIIAKVGYADRQQAEEALKRLAHFFPTWRDSDPKVRVEILRRAAVIMEERRDELAATMILEAGKGWIEADADVGEAIDFLNYYAAEATRLFQARRLGHYPGEDNRLFYEGRGITSVICPWNFPLAIPCGMFSAAIVTGNVAALKPSGLTCLIASKLFSIMLEAGLPPEAAAFLPGTGGDVGALIVTHPSVSTIVFTGSKEVGLHILKQAGETTPGQEHVKRVIVEMGGKNAIIVDENADLDEAVKGVLYSAFGFQGQKCSACSRAIILESVYDTFTERLADAVRSMIVGPSSDPSSFVGPVIDDVACDRLNRVIDEAKRECRLLAQASLEDTPTQRRANGYYVLPTVFVDVPRQHFIIQNELFGPILALLKVKDFGEAIKVANDSEFGLTGAIFSRSPQNIETARKEFRVGNLYINRGSTGALVMRQPFGGAKMSGVGSKAGGPDYLLQFVIPKAISENTMRRGFAPNDSAKTQP